MRKKLFYPVLLLLAISFVGMVSCVKQDFDMPPAREIPVGEIISITDLRQMYVNEAVLIDTAMSIVGIVVGDETSGNIYKNSYIQDGTGAINLRLKEGGGLYEGDSVRVYMEGLMLTNYAGVIQLDSVDVDLNITKLKTNVYVEPKLVTIPELLTDEYQSTLIKLENVQFVSTDTVKTWSDAVELTTQNRYLQDCDFNAVIVRTSGYANFADQPIPTGKGTFIAIASSYNGEIQLYVRDVTEIDMTGERCEGGGGGLPEPNITIPELKLLYEGQRLQIADDLVIGARVVANDESGNYYKTIVIQDEAGGIELKINDYDLFNAFPLGQEIYIKCKDLYLDTYGGVIQLGSIYESGGEWLFGGIQPTVLGNYVVYGTSVEPIEPTVVTITEIDESKIGTLIQLNEVQFIEAELGTTWADPVNHYSVNHTLENCDSEPIIVRTSGYASFAGENIPEGNGTFIGVVSAYNGDMQLYVRQLADITLTGERCEGGGGGGSIFMEDFNSNLGSFTSHSVTGNQVWGWDDFDGGCTKMSGYASSTNYANEDWLVSPSISLVDKTGVTMNFREAINYITNISDLMVLISTDYDGTSSPDESGTWDEVTGFTRAAGNNWTFVDCGDVSLSEYEGQIIYVAFKYVSSSTDASTWEISRVEVKN